MVQSDFYGLTHCLQLGSSPTSRRLSDAQPAMGPHPGALGSTTEELRQHSVGGARDGNVHSEELLYANCLPRFEMDFYILVLQRTGEKIVGSVDKRESQKWHTSLFHGPIPGLEFKVQTHGPV